MQEENYPKPPRMHVVPAEALLKPTIHAMKNTKLEQFLHIKEEVDEVRDALNDYALEYEKTVDKIAEEVVDLQMSCETLLAILGLNEHQRNEVRRKVIAKNDARGYYNG